MTSVQFTVGKVDAGMAILLTEDHHLIEFPSLLLPNGVASGSIVNISVSRNTSEEERKMNEFWDWKTLFLKNLATPHQQSLRYASRILLKPHFCWNGILLFYKRPHFAL
ncbi:unnamed protein product [Absidia cylindrospora]